MISQQQDLEFMRQAFELSKNCKPEDDRVHPYVGAVIVNAQGHLISTGYRGQTPGKGAHAEQEALKDQRPDVLRGATVYTTLEPCTIRGREPSCCSRLIRAEVAEVVIGMLDPNRDIRGKGWWELEQNNINVRYFDASVVREIRRLNRDFIEYQLGVGLMITAVQPNGRPEIAVTPDHRAKTVLLEVPSGKIIIRGTYRVKPTRGDRIVMLVRRGRKGTRYFPQETINFDYDREKGIWQAPSAWVRAVGDTAENEFVIARVSDDLDVAMQHYVTVHTDVLKDHKIDKWIGIIMDAEPPGLERLASLWVRVAT
jgi:pyrimidine deaminase RibD-like protein